MLMSKGKKKKKNENLASQFVYEDIFVTMKSHNVFESTIYLVISHLTLSRGDEFESLTSEFKKKKKNHVMNVNVLLWKLTQKVTNLVSILPSKDLLISNFIC